MAKYTTEQLKTRLSNLKTKMDALRLKHELLEKLIAINEQKDADHDATILDLEKKYDAELAK